MYVVMVASECAPVAKVGGLADMVYGLAREVAIRGNSVEVILPKYDCMRYDHIWGLAVAYDDLWVPWWDGAIHCTVWSGFVHGVLCFFIEPHSNDHFFDRGAYYGFFDESVRFAFFAKAALEYMYKSGKRPDIIHTHDWQAALTPVLLFEQYAKEGMENCRVVHTIHNFKHQGVAGQDILAGTGLGRPEFYCDQGRLGDHFNPSALNFTNGAVVYANFITTVSPKHAWEARHTDQGYGLGHTLHEFQDKFGGILNGLDYEMWNPGTDPHIPHHFSPDDLLGKDYNKGALRDRLMLAHAEEKPVIAYVGRLDTQKGVHLIRHAIFTAIWNGAQFVLLGSSPEHGINDDFWHLKHFLNENPDCHLEIGFNEELAHLIYAGSDMFVVPSLFEPCGLTQMIALRYGTIPIVRAVGGLADTVFDWDHSELPRERRNGFTFDHPDYAGLDSALHRALGLWRESPDLWRELKQTALRYDYSWNHPGEHYAKIYEFVRHK